MQVQKEAPQRKKSGEKVSKTFDLNCADELTANNKGSSFGQEKLLALDEGDLWNFQSITFLELSLFEAVTVINISP